MVSVPSRGLCFQSCLFNDIHDRIDEVSVPSRGLCFQSLLPRRGLWLSRWRFRPLSGIMFSIKDKFHDMTYKEAVSVPSRGLCFQSPLQLVSDTIHLSFPSPLGDYVFNRKKKPCEPMNLEKFPSPLGDYVFNRIRKLRWQAIYHKTFPSPLGDYVFNRFLSPLQCPTGFSVSVPSRGLCFQSDEKKLNELQMTVSVPSRGLCFQSCDIDYDLDFNFESFRPLSGIMFSIIKKGERNMNKLEQVSVPSRGLCFQSEKGDKKYEKILWFPSPLGDYVFNLVQHKVWKLSEWFPSPLGDYVFNQGEQNYVQVHKRRFPSPLGDYVFNRLYGNNGLTERGGFRPLSGIMFSIAMMKEGKSSISNVSVPSRGLCFQSIMTTNEKRRAVVASVPSRGLCFQSIFTLRTLKEYRLWFPSPLGDYVFNPSKTKHIAPPQVNVSVPSRGLCFQSAAIYLKWQATLEVSVPSRGLCFQSRN